MAFSIALVAIPPFVGFPVAMVSITEDVIGGMKEVLPSNLGGGHPSINQILSSSSRFGDLSTESKRPIDMGDGADVSGFKKKIKKKFSNCKGDLMGTTFNFASEIAFLNLLATACDAFLDIFSFS